MFFIHDKHADAADDRRRHRLGQHPDHAVCDPGRRAAANRMGYYMGLFNFFVVIPQIVSGLLLGFFTKHCSAAMPCKTLMLGGVCMVLAAC
jgi:hypothetical protein